jgi:hypothetical protein
MRVLDADQQGADWRDSVESRCFEAGILIGKNLQTIGGGESGHVP